MSLVSGKGALSGIAQTKPFPFRKNSLCIHWSILPVADHCIAMMQSMILALINNHTKVVKPRRFSLILEQTELPGSRLSWQHIGNNADAQKHP